MLALQLIKHDLSIICRYLFCHSQLGRQNSHLSRDSYESGEVAFQEVAIEGTENWAKINICVFFWEVPLTALTVTQCTNCICFNGSV